MKRRHHITKYGLALGLAAFVLCVIGATSVRFIQQERQAEAWAVQTYEVLGRLSAALEHVLDAETLQVRRSKLLCEFLPGIVFRIDPFIQ